MDGLEINGNPWPSAQDGISNPYETAQPPDVKVSDYIVIKTTGFLGATEQDQLKADKVDIIEYLGDDAYLCGFKPTTEEEFDAVKAHSFVTDAHVFHPNCVAEPSLKQGNPDEEVDVEISLHGDIPDSRLDDIKAQIASVVGVPPDSLEITDDGVTKIAVPREKLKPLAEIDEVFAINKYPVPKLLNNVACEIMRVRGPPGTATAQNKYNGSGQGVFVADTGFDNGKLENYHPAFGTRVKRLYPLGRPTLSNDPDGHGTHVAGSVLGKLKHSTGVMIEGPASGAELYFQSVFDGQFFPDEQGNWNASLSGLAKYPVGTPLFKPAIDQKVYIHTNSWGSGGGYTAQTAGSIDDFAWRNPALTILFAAGNDAAAQTIGNEASARNCITVGASNSTKPTPGEAPASPNSMAWFSSRGPTIPGRQIKPDVVAPGTRILSALSTQLHPLYREDSVLQLDPTDTERRWQFMQGTSMATPLVAGCCAALRQALKEANDVASPSSALIKALLVNGAEPLTPSEAPNPTSGFGRVNMSNTLQHTGTQQTPPLAGFGDRFGPNALRHSRAAGDKLDQFSFDIQVPAGGRTLAVTLVWPDPSGEKLQHYLDLSVTHGTQTRAWGVNQKQNNVQRITWKNAPAGTYNVLVKALSIFDQPPQVPKPVATPGQPEPVERKLPAFQPFAYAWRIY